MGLTILRATYVHKTEWHHHPLRGAHKVKLLVVANTKPTKLTTMILKTNNSNHTSNKRMRIDTTSTTNDDSSTSSTMTVDDRKMTKALSIIVLVEHHKNKPPTNKSVSIDLQHNESYDCTSHCKEDCAERWYSVADCQQFRQETLALAKAVRTTLSSSSSFSYERVLLRVFGATHKPDGEVLEEDLEYIYQWLNNDDHDDGAADDEQEDEVSLLGLEKWAVKAIRRDRSLRRNTVINVVLELQDKKQQKSPMPYSDEELIAMSSRGWSRRSVDFARIMAHAQVHTP